MVDAAQTTEETPTREVVDEVAKVSEVTPADEVSVETPAEEEIEEKIEEMEDALDDTANDGVPKEDGAEDDSTPPADDEASVAAKRETDKLREIMKTTMKTTRKSLKGARKSIKKNVKALKKAGKKKMGKSKSGVPQEIVTPKEMDEIDPAKADTDSESGEKEDEIKQLRKKIQELQEDNLDLRCQVKVLKGAGSEPEEPFDEKMSDEGKTLLENESYEDMDPEEKIKSLEFQVGKWQKLYLESNEIGPSRVEKLEEGYDEASSIARSTNDEKNDHHEDRILMLEYQLRESVKVLKTAQKKMVGQHEKEFHLQKTVDDLSDQILDLTTKLENSKEEHEEFKGQLEEEQKAKAEVEAMLAAERQRLDDFREDLGLEPMYKAEVADDSLENQIQDDNSSYFCFGPAKTIEQ
jgi:predicted  nucleic acid-binding Zn-ribbon protein